MAENEVELPQIDSVYLLNRLTGLLNTPSPTGFTAQAIDSIEQALGDFDGLKLSRTRKGALLADWPGLQSDQPRILTAHVDTLGAVVKEIKSSGRLRLSKIGGFSWNTVEGEGCTVFTAGGAAVRGSILFEKASGHIYSKEVGEGRREDETMEVRLDARLNSPEETRALGIEVGDFVAFDPRLEINNGFIRSRHLDDKACVACILAAVKALCDAGLKPRQQTYLFISNYEEVGHGAAGGIPADAAELLVVDMAVVGNGQNSDEFHASVCTKDGGGPYHHELTRRLRRLAETHQIPYKADVFIHYGSDGESYWHAGGDVAVGLIGPGVDASHNYERTHLDALAATTRWLVAYLLS